MSCQQQIWMPNQCGSMWTPRIQTWICIKFSTCLHKYVLRIWKQQVARKCLNAQAMNGSLWIVSCEVKVTLLSLASSNALPMQIWLCDLPCRCNLDSGLSPHWSTLIWIQALIIGGTRNFFVEGIEGAKFSGGGAIKKMAKNGWLEIRLSFYPQLVAVMSHCYLHQCHPLIL